MMPARHNDVDVAHVHSPCVCCVMTPKQNAMCDDTNASCCARIHHECADPVPAAMLQEVLHAIADKHRKQAKRPQLIGLHGRVPNPQLVALMKDCWHPVRSCCLLQLSMLCQSHCTLARSQLFVKLHAS